MSVPNVGLQCNISIDMADAAARSRASSRAAREALLGGAKPCARRAAGQSAPGSRGADIVDIRNGNGYGRATDYGISGLLSLSISVFRKKEQGEVRVR